MSITHWVIIAVILVGAVIALFGWDRYRGTRKSAGGDSTFQPTDEVFTDPATGKRTRVWSDPKTGQREYRTEPS
jgi:hypothetical protein